jgi:hypothetical protein
MNAKFGNTGGKKEENWNLMTTLRSASSFLIAVSTRSHLMSYSAIAFLAFTAFLPPDPLSYTFCLCHSCSCGFLLIYGPRWWFFRDEIVLTSSVYEKQVNFLLVFREIVLSFTVSLYYYARRYGKYKNI